MVDHPFCVQYKNFDAGRKRILTQTTFIPCFEIEIDSIDVSTNRVDRFGTLSPLYPY